MTTTTAAGGPETTKVRVHKAQQWRVLSFVGDNEVRVRGHRVYGSSRRHWAWLCDEHGRTRNCPHVTATRDHLKGMF
ncbi:hypothetical protein [Rhodococcus sp. SGAir0479]|uniref:hypothetical protein n=1 Tax=Rhodococcus sp. SGAir0479 TaxID=2567884 RepID=UPI0010CD0CF8|nr:hypothetical protein [Rhodococcus sp. SGAir0479]QCQ93041.1 hypothetical protein E7742_18655 [Rhodococcus sp. SGAir0479]